MEKSKGSSVNYTFKLVTAVSKRKNLKYIITSKPCGAYLPPTHFVIIKKFIQILCLFSKYYFCHLILLFSLFLLLFMSFTVLFDVIYGSHYTILANFCLYLQYFQQKILSFSKISEFSTDT